MRLDLRHSPPLLLREGSRDDAVKEAAVVPTVKGTQLASASHGRMRARFGLDR